MALEQLKNNVEVIGTLKSLSLEEKTSKNNKEMIIGNVVVEVKDGDKVNNVFMNVLQMKFKKDGVTVQKPFTALQTVMNEYKTIDDHGRENADVVRITGQYDVNEYYTEEGEFRSRKQLRTQFFNRLNDKEVAQKALVSIDLVVKSIQDEVDSDGLVTGRLKVNGFNVGYNGKYIPLDDLIVNEDLAQPFRQLYFEGTTGLVTIQVNNYAEIEIVEVEQPAHGFGSTEKVEDKIVNNYVNEYVIIGGDIPYNGTSELLPEDIEEAEKARKVDLQAMKSNMSAPAQPTGFGSKAPAQQQAEIDKAVDKIFASYQTLTDDMPDF